MNSKLKGFLGFLVGIVLMAGLFFLMVSTMQKSERSFSKERVTYENERQAAYDEAKNLDPEEHKVVLTDRFLSAEYRLFYESRKAGTSAFSKIVTIFLIVMVVVVIGSAVFSYFRAARRGDSFSLIRLIFSLVVPLVFIGIFFFISRSFLSMSKYPKPDKCSFKPYTLNVLDAKTKTTTSTDSDGSTSETTHYYIYYEGKNNTTVELNVASSVYDSFSKPGIYFLYAAEEGSDFVYFGLYSEELYKLAA